MLGAHQLHGPQVTNLYTMVNTMDLNSNFVCAVGNRDKATPYACGL
jgi:hypothetical protein